MVKEIEIPLGNLTPIVETVVITGFIATAFVYHAVNGVGNRDDA